MLVMTGSILKRAKRVKALVIATHQTIYGWIIFQGQDLVTVSDGDGHHVLALRDVILTQEF